MPPMQKRALYEFIAYVVLAVILVPVILFVTSGPSDTSVLLILVILVITPTGLAYWIPRYLTRPRPDQPVIMDERDRAVLSHVPRYQYAGILFTIGVWVITLVTVYRHRGEVPVELLWLMWWSVVIANGIFTTAGVMIGYWRAESSTETEENPDYSVGGLSRQWQFTVAFAVLIVAMIVAICISTFESSQSGPRADFTTDVVVAQVGAPIQFTNTTEREDTSFFGKAAARRWEFGDCTHSDLPNPEHIYGSSGQYTVELTVFYDGGAEVSATKDITVLPAGSP